MSARKTVICNYSSHAIGLNFIEMKIHRALLHVNVTRTLNLSQISLFSQSVFTHRTAPPFLKLHIVILIFSMQ